MKWIAKAIIQKVISQFPNRVQINYLFQKHVTRGVLLDDVHFTYKLEHARDHIAYLRKYQGEGEFKILELGTGWYPIIPLCLYLSECGETTSIDIQHWLTKENQLIAIRKLLAWSEDGRLTNYLPYHSKERLEKLRFIATHEADFTYDQINSTIGLAPMLKDARDTGFADGSFDFICSNNTFEHIYPDVLAGILKEFKRVVKPSGLMSHFVDLSDHFAHFDGAINIYNFLKFSPQWWATIDNRIQPQNRLRWPDYLEMYRKLDIPVSEQSVREGSLDLLAEVPVHKSFKHMSPQELAISHGYLVSQLRP